ncbi:MAG: MBL fold metallo-hydrolase, partial [Chloroflexota bacterium]
MTSSELYSLKVGAFDLLFFKDGGGPRDAAGFLPSAPQDELERIIRAQNFDPAALEFALKPILITHGDQRILIDTGLGLTMSRLPDRLRENGVTPEEISLIIITHGHGDHIGGIFDAEGNFVYPNASYVLWRSEWAYWTAEERFDAADTSHAKQVWQALKANAGRVRLIDERNPQIAPGICAVPIPGHTVGQIGVELESHGEKFLHVADAAHHTFQLACPQWSPQFDADKAQAAETRRAIFERAARDGVLLSAYHFTFPGVG